MVVTVIALELLFVLLIVCLLCRAPYGVLAHQPLGGGRRSDWREAQERAEQMLRDVLAEDEYRQLCRRGYLEVPSRSRPRRIYRIPRHQGQVKVYEGGVPDHGALRAAGRSGPGRRCRDDAQADD